MEIVQFDIKTIFLYGEVSEEFYMDQLFGFEDATTFHKVCHLHKSIYGLS
jgi:hypothetical protein